MKRNILNFGCLLFLSGSLYAQSGSSVSVPATPSLPDQRVIVIDTEKNPGNTTAPAPFVESGSTIIASEPQENLKVAYRNWEEKCAAWKKELKQNNGKNLLIANCGQANRRSEKIQLTNYFTIESKAEYKIKVGCTD